jgi:hypothetical protein
MAYDRSTVAGNVGLGGVTRQVGPDARPSAVATPPSRRWTIPDGAVTGAAVGLVVLPFLVAVVRLLTEPSGHLWLTDDLALIDLHTRRAIAWRQQLGVFDRNGWSHPGPSYFYLLGIAYRVFGSSGRSLFVGATLLNGAAAVCCVAVVRRFTTATRALWAAFAVSVLAFAMAASGYAQTTYSETVLGALVSPWNPLVVVFPLLLMLLLCAGAMSRSAPCAAGALLVGSFVVQTDVSTLPLVFVALVVAEATWIVTAVRRRRDPAAMAALHRTVLTGRWLIAGALVLVVFMWVPPLIEQFTNHPGNLTLIYRFFTSGRSGHSLTTALGATAAATSVLVLGPSEVMRTGLEGTQHHKALAAVLLAVTVALGLVAVALGRRGRARYAAALGLLSALGCVAVVVGVTHLVGHIYGYLVMWAVVLSAAAVVAVGAVRLPRRWSDGVLRTLGPAAVRAALAVVVLAVSLATVSRVLAMPSLEHASDPEVGRLTALVASHLRTGQVFSVNDARAGTGKNGVLIDIERFFGLINQLDREGYRPKVNTFWQVELGPGYAAPPFTSQNVILRTWAPTSSSKPGYLGRVGDMAVFLVGPADVFATG